MTAKSSNKPAVAPFDVSAEGLQKFGEAIGQAAERSQAVIETGLRTWETELGHYFDDLQTHGRATMEALGKCQGPMDVLAVEQQWLKARAQAYLDSGMRFAKAFADISRSIPAQPPTSAKKAEAAPAKPASSPPAT
jgi:hypothetical protein